MSEEAQVEVAPEKGTPEYNEMMVQRFEGAASEDTNAQSFTAETPPMPENGMDKFYNKETGAYDWSNHVKELEYRLEQQKTSSDESPSESVSKNVTEQPSLDWDKISSDFAVNNELSDDHRKSLNAAGIPDDIINNYLELHSVGQEFSQQRTIEYAGGEENINAMFDWARSNLSEEEVNNYNDMLNSPNWRMAIDSLRVSSQVDGVASDQNSRAPSLVEGEMSGVSGAAFPSKQQMIEAMSDPRYKSDPAFRNQVRLRVGRSNF
tara:strand:- start:23 stop:814 length:792 start_codon:yes stop_codon:yes gene_type:complete